MRAKGTIDSNENKSTSCSCDTSKRGIQRLGLLAELLCDAAPKQLKKHSEIYERVMSHIPINSSVLVDTDAGLGDRISENRSRDLRR